MVGAALAENRLRPAYQPVVRADAPHLVAFHECLARVVDHDGNAIPAGRFIAAVEPTPLGRLLDRAMLQQVLDTLAIERQQRLSVNMSALSVGDRGWLDILRTAVARDPDLGMRLIVEITETEALLMTPETISFLSQVRDLGCSLAVDDFGAGHSSLANLSRFRFDFLKIDGALVRGIVDDMAMQQRLNAVLIMARHFDLVTVAEMAETQEEIDLLARLGVDCIQGYGIAHPDMAPKWLRQG